MFNGCIDNQCTDDELKRIVCKEGLLQYNIDATNGLLKKPGIDINLVARDNDGNVIGGIMCNTYLMIVYIEVLWVHESYRGQALGYSLITEAEKIAKDAGCLYAHTCTYSFQSPNFYIRQGYEVYGINDAFPEGICMYQFKKKL